MANLTRKTAKIFGETASTSGENPKIGQFGSAKAGTYVGTGDIDTIQGLPAWSNGWADAVTPTQQFPALPEMTGVHKVLSYQEAYLLQKGIPDWDSGTTYYQNDFCKVNGTIYRSLSNNNTNHNPTTSPEYWTTDIGYLNKQQVTNCILENPARVDVTLSEGTLTLKAGSVVIVPYGTADLSPAYPKGADFGTGFTVYDTSFHSGLFFVMAQLKADTVLTPTTNNTSYLVINEEGTPNVYKLSDVISDTTVQNSKVVYNPTTNIFCRYSSGGNPSAKMCFPIAIIKPENSVTTEIVQTFNGIGYVGSYAWAAKGIKVLKPNGFNADGTLKNDEYTTTRVNISSSVSGVSDSIRVLYIGTGIGAVQSLTYYPDSNTNSNTTISSTTVPIGYVSIKSGAIEKLYSYSALNINAVCGGQWIDSNSVIANNVACPTNTSITYDLSTYLPNDGFNYEVLVYSACTTGTNVGDQSNVFITSDIISNYLALCRAKTRVQSVDDTSAGSAVIPLGIKRTLTVEAYESNTGTFNLAVRGYRRLGGNF